jgi:hypothetical protein
MRGDVVVVLENPMTGACSEQEGKGQPLKRYLILLAVLSPNLVGDALRDLLDPYTDAH